MNTIGRRIAIMLAVTAGAVGATGLMAQLLSGRPPVAQTVPPSAELDAVRARAASADLQRARWDTLHRFPESAAASDQACLVCHQEVVTRRPREQSPAGVRSADALAWYQTLDTYEGQQETFHWRHLSSPFAQQAMNLSCNFCHQANDPREESPHAMRAAALPSGAPQPFNPPHDLRRTVNTSETCLRCHGSFPAELMGLPEPWFTMREALETTDAPNGCLTCHADAFRTVRHQVSYLRAAGIEEAAQTSSDACFGCHGGRAWYRISYPYPRHAWPGMADDVPDWAKDRPRQSDPRFALPPR